ncbi:MAG: ccmF, partial [Ilumatobacteraceae bacterium]|nr:ccmF [Ilumatobacteraceae bacterium]
LLFLMAVAPVLPWRKASQELLRERLFWPAWAGAAALAFSVFVGADDLWALVAFALGGFAAGAAVRQLVLASRRQGWRGVLGRTNGGMIVHLGVIIIAVALAASNSFSKVSELQLTAGKVASYDGHTYELVDVSGFSDARSTGVRASIKIDGGQAYAPRQTTYTNFGLTVPTPSVKSGVAEDLYLTLEGTPQAGDTTALIKVAVKPMILWLWVGGALMAAGTVLAAFPGRRRRRPTDPVSAPIIERETVDV